MGLLMMRAVPGELIVSADCCCTNYTLCLNAVAAGPSDDRTLDCEILFCFFFVIKL